MRRGMGLGGTGLELPRDSTENNAVSETGAAKSDASGAQWASGEHVERLLAALPEAIREKVRALIQEQALSAE